MAKEPMYQAIYEDVLGKIRSGEVEVGDRVDSEKDLAEKYGVSRITTKKALSMLCNEGYIIRKPGKGSFVADPLSVAAIEKKKKEASRKTLGFITDYVGNGFALNLFNQISRQGTEAGYNILISLSHASQEIEMSAIDTLKQSHCHGIILIPVMRAFYNHEVIRSIADHYPILTIDRELTGLPAPCVSTDHRKASYELTEYLIRRGHRRIAFIDTRIDASKSEELRALGYRDAMEKYQLQHNALIFKPSEHLRTRDLPYVAGKAETVGVDVEKIEKISAELYGFLEESPQITATVCCTHSMAYLTYTVLQRHGKSVPKDISVVCFDEVDQVQHHIYFTHYHQDEAGIARSAIQLMAELIHGGVTDENISNIFVPGRIIEGNSVSEMKLPGESG